MNDFADNRPMTILPPGASVCFDRQTYRPVGNRQVQKPDGAWVWVVDWETDCPDCGAVFIATTPKQFKSPRRFCDACKAPGKTVKRFRKSSKGKPE